MYWGANLYGPLFESAISEKLRFGVETHNVIIGNTANQSVCIGVKPIGVSLAAIYRL